MSDFQIGERIGEGGQGEVFRAIAPNGQTVALKRFRPPPNATPAELENYRTRFRREIEVTSSLRHRNIVTILSDNLTSDTPYYVMPWAESRLADTINTSPNGLAIADAIDILVEVCQGMAHAHRNDILHRDLNPRNILIFSGVPKVADFGLGRSIDSMTSTLTQSNMGWGTMHYMAPEQMTALHLAGKRADVFSLGVIAFQLTTGLPPHLAKMRIDHVPPELRFIVTKCLRDSEDERYANAEQLLEALQRAQSADPSKQAAPKQRAEAALSAFKAGNSNAIEEIADILQSSPGDSQLYRIFLPTLPLQALRKLPHLTSIVTHYDEEFASENTSFEYTDTIAKFYTNCLKVLQSLNVRARVLGTLLQQAYQNNRYFAGQRFATICADMWGDSTQAELVIEVLRNNPDAHDFVRSYFADYSLPAVVGAVLAEPDGGGTGESLEEDSHAVVDEDDSDDPWAEEPVVEPVEDPWGTQPSTRDPWRKKPVEDPWGARPSTRDPWAEKDPWA